MLYNQDWDTKVDVHSLASLIAWLEKQDATAVYDYCSTNGCLLQQYYTAMGFECVCISAKEMRYGHSRTWIPLPDDFNDIALQRYTRFGGARDRGKYRTFGDALKNAKRIRDEHI